MTLFKSIDRAARPHLVAGAIAGFLVLATSIAVFYDLGGTMFLPTIILTAVLARMSPPVAALLILYSSSFYGGMDFKGAWIIPRIPATSTMILWTILCLIYGRLKDGSLRNGRRVIVVQYFLLIASFLAMGIVVAFTTGKLSNNVVRFYNWDIVRQWLGYLVVAWLGCKDLKELKILMIGLSFAFLIYPLSLPLQAWKDILEYGLSSTSVYGIGLSYGALNPNTLGQAASIAGVAAAAVSFTMGRSLGRYCLLVMFLVCMAIVLMTGSRQALIALLAGLIVVVIVSGSRRSIVWIPLLGLTVYFGGQALLSALPSDSGFQKRLNELSQASEMWESGSYSVRKEDFEEAVEAWQHAPVFGMGFGGQRYNEIPPTVGQEDLGEYSFSLNGSHNLFLGILAQTGLIGLILFVLFHVGLATSFLRKIRSAPVSLRGNENLARVSIAGSLACIFVVENISGGMLGSASATLAFLSGAMLSVLGAAQGNAVMRG